MQENPFHNIESARQYLRLLADEVRQVRGEISADVSGAVLQGSSRRVDALHLVEYKLKQLEERLASSGRILNDLQMLRRLLLQEPDKGATTASAEAESIEVPYL